MWGGTDRVWPVIENVILVGLLVSLVWMETATGGTPVREPPEAALDRLLASDPALDEILRTLVEGAPDSGLSVRRWDHPVQLSLHGEPTGSDRQAAARAVEVLVPLLGGTPITTGETGANLRVYVVPRAEFDAYDQGGLAETSWLARAFVAPSGAIERGRILVAAELPEVDRARVLERLIARVLGLTHLPIDGGPEAALSAAERAALAFLYRADVPLGAALPPRRRP